MLTIVIPEGEFFDEATKQFVYPEETRLDLEHSLFSLSKWESIWEKPFLGPEEKSPGELLGYIKAMTLTPDIAPEVYQRLSDEHITTINDYINAKMSATWFRETKQKPGRKEVITAEIIYYWMISLNIPLEFEHRHLNQLFTLIKVCNEKNAPEDKPKRSQAEMMAERKAINEARMKQYNTKG